MSALLKMEMYEAVAEAALLKKSTGWVPEVIVTAHLASAAPIIVEEPHPSIVKNVGLFIASPFIALAYIVAMPFVAIGMIAWFAAKALVAKVPPSVKKTGMIIAAPFIGLVFIVALPLAGVTALGYYALKAAEKA